MGAHTQVTRAEFLQTASAVGAGLVIGFYLPPGRGRAAAAAGPFAPNAWLRIGTDDSLLVMVDRSEMGQGVATSLPMLLAEELEADWSKIDRKSTRLNSSHGYISYAVFCLEKKNQSTHPPDRLPLPP